MFYFYIGMVCGLKRRNSQSNSVGTYCGPILSFTRLSYRLLFITVAVVK